MPMLGNIAALCQVPVSYRASVEWRHYAGDQASTKYSTLDQINGDNFSKLKVAWTWQSAEQDILKQHNLRTWAWEATPLMIDGVLYLTTSLSQAVALDAATGKMLLGLRPGNMAEWHTGEQRLCPSWRCLLG